MPFWINVLVGVLAFAVAALGGKALIPWLHKLKFGQPIKVEFGPKWHANKQGTPTMGGILFIVGSIVATAAGYAVYRMTSSVDVTAISGNREALRVMSCVIFCLLFGIIGFIDDFAKVAKKQNEGLTPKQKLALQVVAAILWLAAMYWLGDRSTTIDLVFVRFDIRWFYYPVMVLVILYLTNAVNLTDGVDGLCGTVTLVAMLIFTLICSQIRQKESYLYRCVRNAALDHLHARMKNRFYDINSKETVRLAAEENAPGDEQAMIEQIAAIYRRIEALPEQGRRIFKMTPIHHHFEMSGFSEYKIVITFSLFGLIAGAVGLLLVTL